MTVTSERTMTLDGQIAIPLDTAANREPFLIIWFRVGVSVRQQPFVFDVASGSSEPNSAKSQLWALFS